MCERAGWTRDMNCERALSLFMGKTHNPIYEYTHTNIQRTTNIVWNEIRISISRVSSPQPYKRHIESTDLFMSKVCVSDAAACPSMLSHFSRLWIDCCVYRIRTERDV